MKKLFFFIIILVLLVVASLMWRSTGTEAAWFSSGVPDSWYNASWNNRVAITVASTSVPANQTDFSLILDLSLLPASFHTNVKEDGGDIRVTTSDGETEVPRDVIYYATSTDTGIMRFKGDVSSTTDTVFYVYYGNASATEPAADATYGRYNAYDASWEGYWPDGGGVDRTVNGDDGSAASAGNPTIGGTVGKLGAATEFDGSNDHVTTSAIVRTSVQAKTVVSWNYVVDPQPSTVGGRIISTRHNNGWLFATRSSNALQFIAIGSTNLNKHTDNAKFSLETWHQFVLTHTGDTATATASIYIDTVEPTYQTETAGASLATPDGAGTRFGAEASTSGSITTWYKGKIDEIHVHSVVRSSTWITTEYNQTNDNEAFWGVGGAETYNPGWSGRVAITVDADQVPANQTDFSLILDLSLLPAGFHTNVKEDGSDIRVTTSDGSTEVPRDVISYATSTDTGIMRFKGDISSTTDTVFYVYYGNASATEPAADATYGRYNAYDASWEGYWPTGHGTDRTSAGNDATDTGTVSDVAGLLGEAADFENTAGGATASEYSDLNLDPSSTLQTMLGFVLFDALPTGSTFSNFGAHDLANHRFYLGYRNDLGVWIAGYGSGSVDFSSTPSIDTWYMVGMTFDSGTLTPYINATPFTAATGVTFSGTSTSNIYTGARSGGVHAAINGKQQHLSIHSTARSSTWITTEYNQTNDNEAFWGVGGAETEAGEPAVPAEKVNIRINAGSKIKIQSGGKIRINN